ncbi:MAG: phosphatidate cytidylyltransferase [Bacteroidota bacterium]
MSNLLQRLLTGLVAGAVAIGAVVSSAYGLWLFGLIVSLAGLWEFLKLKPITARYSSAALVAGGLLWVVELGMLYWVPESDVTIHLLPLLPVCFLLIALFNPQEKVPVESLGHIMLGLVYCFGPLLLFFRMGFEEGNVNPVTYDFRFPLGILALIWTLDVGAYFGGRTFGKHPLFPRISPKKTWEGSIVGSLLCLALAGWLTTWDQTTNVHGINWLIIGVLVCVFSQLGDLVESMFKRSVSLKDSGSILPGHGGMLDRFDGLYLAAPFIFFYFFLS